MLKNLIISNQNWTFKLLFLKQVLIVAIQLVNE